MAVIIKKITLNNFGGISHAEYNFDENNNVVSGSFGAGKSSSYLAYLWALGLNVPTWEPQIDGFRISKLRTEVVVELDVNGSLYTLSKTNSPEYKIDKFTGEEVYTGTNFEYLFDNQPMTFGAYKEKIVDLFGVQDHFTLELLSDISLFNSEDNKRWNKDERRKFLFKLFDIDKKVEQLASLPEFEPIKEYLNNGKDEIEINSILNALKSSIDKEIKSNQVIMQEKQNELAEYSVLDFNALREQKKEIDAKLEQLTEQQKDSACSSLLSQKQEELSRLTLDLSKQQTENLKAKLEYDKKVSTLRQQIESTNEMIRVAKENIADAKTQINQLEKKYNEVNETVFDEQNSFCPTCHQKFPVDKLQELETNFTTWKNQEIAETKKKASIQNKRKMEYEKAIAESEPANEEAKIQLQDLLGQDYNVFDTSIIESVIKQKQEELINISSGNVDNSLKDQISSLKLEQEKLIAEIYKEELLNKIKTRIEELKSRARELGVQDAERLAKKQALQKFMQKKVEFVNEQVNNHFVGVRYNFFKWNAGNDATREFVPICEAVLASSGASFDSLSSGEKVLVNYWTNNSLRKILNINIPQFVDDCVLSNFSQQENNNWQSIFLITDNTRKLDLTLIKDVYTIENCDKKSLN